ncbi:endonuclease/exonuclease/phosphatase family protein [Pseudidiomarina sp.]|uniref:endonuclease/exonuclease/phosphatase family protein n=1 Tax=Pseudidiomarina sp. TaxID=2081707 RepID=UPI003A981837
MPKEKINEPVALRVATFNVSMDASNYLAAEELPHQGASALRDALAQQHPQIQAIAEIVQHTRPDVLVLNEFDYIDQQQGIDVFKRDYLAVSQNGESPIDYPYTYIAPVNTGVPSPYDLSGDGNASGTGNDAWGFGLYPGQYGMAVLSKYPIQTDAVRTFQMFKWKDMPGALAPLKPGTSEPFYSTAAWQEFRLSSKSHWDVPIAVNQHTLHVLVSHPTPPVFDGKEDRNGRRNHDEIRFWADYIQPHLSDYIYDDNGNYGGLGEGQAFVIAGDLNASVESEDNVPGAIAQLLAHPKVNAQITPESRGGAAHSPDNPQASTHTAGWRKRADYVLPSVAGISLIQAGVFWPEPNAAKAELVRNREVSSDHRLVWIDIQLK